MTDQPQPVPSNWNLPNALTTLRIVMVPFFGWALLVDDGGSVGWRVVAWVLFALAMLTDKVDGDIARSRNLVTDFGKIADPIADKALTGMAFVGLSIIGDLWWWVTALVLLREWGITLLRLWVIRYGVMAAGRGGKLKTVLQTLALGLFVLPIRILQDDWASRRRAVGRRRRPDGRRGDADRGHRGRLRPQGARRTPCRGGLRPDPLTTSATPSPRVRTASVFPGAPSAEHLP